jgi:glycosyltransferase involved in cell wall biosynthesis
VLIRSHNLLREVARHFEVDLLAFNQAALMRGCFADPDDGLRVCTEALGRFVRIIGIHPIPAERSRWHKRGLAFTSLFTRTPYSVRWLESRPYADAVANALARQRYDLVHVDTESLVPFVPDTPPCPVVLDHHNVESHMLERRAGNEPNPLRAAYFRIEAAKLRAFERAHLHRFSSHLVCSAEDRERLLQVESRARAFVAPNSIDFPPLARRAPASAPDNPKLLFVGGLTWYPNHDAVVHFLEDIWPGLVARVPQLSVDIVGRSPSARIRELAGRLSNVRLHGFVDDIAAMYAAATAYICPIRDGGGTKLKVVDAIANGVPMIAHPVACEGLDLRHGEHVLLARTVDEYQAAIARIRTDYAAAQDMAGRAYEFARSRYDSGVVGTNLAAHLEALMRERPPRGDHAVPAPA